MTGPARVSLSVPVLGPNAREYLLRCVDENFVSSVGPFVDEFEQRFAATVGASHAVACSSGTAALHLALIALGFERGREAWVSDLTFIASANPVRLCGGSVRLVDSERDSWNIDAELVVDEWDRMAAAGEQLPAALIAVHLLGHPARLEAVVAAGALYGVAVVEDACEALGASWMDGALAGRQVGTVGTVGCFSFNGNKLMTTGSGGMVVTEDKDLAGLCRHLSTQAKLPGEDYRHDRIGFNYRMPNIAAALGLAQLEDLPELLSGRRDVAARYDAAFAGKEAVVLPPDQPWAQRSCWLYTVLLPDVVTRERVRTALAAGGIESRSIWPPLHTQAPYRDSLVLGDGYVSEEISTRALSIPSSPDLTEQDQQDVVETVLAAVDRR